MNAPDLRSDETKAIDAVIARARAAEREHCIRIAELEAARLTSDSAINACRAIAVAIRRRAETIYSAPSCGSENDYRNAKPQADAAVSVPELKERIDLRLNNYLSSMKHGYDDSITGFNEAWTIVQKAFSEAAISQPQQTGESVSVPSAFKHGDRILISATFNCRTGPESEKYWVQLDGNIWNTSVSGSAILAAAHLAPVKKIGEDEIAATIIESAQKHIIKICDYDATILGRAVLALINSKRGE